MWYYNSVVNNKYMEKSARTYTITEETLERVRHEGIKAKDKEEMLASIKGFQGTAIGASIFVKLAPDDYPVEELMISIITAQTL